MSKTSGYQLRSEGNLYVKGLRGSICVVFPTPSKAVRQSYQQMHQRCYNPNRPHWARYGGRGIYVVDEWHSFAQFFSDMGEKPEGLTLERLDNDGPYSPDNCVWATKMEQAQNREKTNWLEYNGETKCLADWARQYGVKVCVLANRIRLLGWTPERALTT